MFNQFVIIKLTQDEKNDIADHFTKDALGDDCEKIKIAFLKKDIYIKIATNFFDVMEFNFCSEHGSNFELIKMEKTIDHFCSLKSEKTMHKYFNMIDENVDLEKIICMLISEIDSQKINLIQKGLISFVDFKMLLSKIKMIKN